MGRREVQNGVVPDPDIDGFMKAISLGGQKENLVTDYVMKILGLDICADTLVGNQLIRGVSGGQRKRVTTGERLPPLSLPGRRGMGLLGVDSCSGRSRDAFGKRSVCVCV